ncbi:MAG: ribonuclease J, partial [bacterium]|nr:ribonuclease J [bacterium]
DGMVVVVVTLDREGKIASSPDIISRGFIYVKNAEQLISAVRAMTKQIIEKNDMKNIENWTSVRNRLRDDIGAFLFQKTEKRPMIIPVIIRV